MEIQIYSSYKEDYVSYSITWNEKGWKIGRDPNSEETCDITGYQKLWKLMREDRITIPRNMPYKMEEIWKEQNEQKLIELMEWISEQEKQK